MVLLNGRNPNIETNVKVVNVDGCLESSDATSSQSNHSAEKVSGADRINGYLFYPEIKTKTKKKKSKDHNPFAATGTEWRNYHTLKNKQKEEEQQKKENNKMIKAKKKNIKQKLDKDLKKN